MTFSLPDDAETSAPLLKRMSSSDRNVSVLSDEPVFVMLAETVSSLLSPMLVSDMSPSASMAALTVMLPAVPSRVPAPRSVVFVSKVRESLSLAVIVRLAEKFESSP